MRLELSDQSRLVASFWKDAPSVCPSHDVPMRTFFVDRVYKPQVVMVCPKGKELFHPVRIVLTGAHSGPEFDKIIPLFEDGSALGLGVKSVAERGAAVF